MEKQGAHTQSLASQLEQSLDDHNGMLSQEWLTRILRTLRPIQGRLDGLITNEELGRVLRKRWKAMTDPKYQQQVTDIQNDVAIKVYGVPFKELGDEERQRVKAITYGFAYASRLRRLEEKS